jgi:photosystem II stability/assembly factor-like uncharacterized protein
MNKKLFFGILLLSLIVLSGISCTNNPSNLGVFRSDDGGKTWQQKVKIDDKKSIKSVSVISLSIDPVDSKIIFIGTREKGLYKTLDEGETWQQLSLASGNINSISIDQKDPNVIYIAGYFGTLGKIFKSTDGGQNFEEIYSETHEKNDVTSLVIDSYDTRKIYAGTSEGSVLKSEDGGRSWILQDKLDSSIVCMAISSHDTRNILIGTASDGIYKTTNGGEEWVNLKEKISSEFSDKTARVRSLVFDPSKQGRVYFASLEGFLISDNGGESWKKIDILTEIGKKGTTEIAINSNPPSIYLGIDSAVYKSNDDGQSWEVNRITTNLIHTIVCDFKNSQKVYVGVAKLSTN